MRLLRPIGLAVTAIVALSLVACGDEASARVRQVVSTTSFGMCVGYCITRLEVSEGQAVLIRTARGGRGGSDLPEQRFTATLAPSEWQEIAQLAENTRLEGLPSVIGCPDCADGGAESLIIVGPVGSQTVAFEHGANIEQAQPLLNRVRVLRTRLTPKS